MVKIQSRLIRKHYKKSNQPYAYTQLLLPIPTRYSKVLEPFLKKKLHFTIDTKEGFINIGLTEHQDRNQEKS